MRKKKLLWITGVLLAANFAVGIRVLAKLGDSDGLARLDLIPQAMSIIENRYVESVEKEKLVYGALRGMLDSLDLHSQFLAPEALKEMEVETSGTYGGVGMELTKKRGVITVVSPFVGSPAYRAGLMAGDRIVKIDGETLRNPDSKEVLSMLRGEPGTKVTLMVVRYDPVLRQDTIKTFAITRAVIKVTSIAESKVLEDAIGYVKITQFQERTAPDLHRRLTELEDQGMGALILDLRDNPGGLLPSAVDVADLFIPEGHVLVSLKGRGQAERKDYVSHEAGTQPMYPVIVLINGQSASGSEIVAGAIKDLKRGVLIGEHSYGKASVQTLFRVGREAALKLTTAKYYTPNGTSIEDKGVEPDVVVAVTLEQEMQRRMLKYEEMDKALGPEEEGEGQAEGRGTSEGSEKRVSEGETLENLIGKKTEEKEFVDVQLQEAVRIVKALRAIGGEKMFAMTPAKAA